MPELGLAAVLSAVPILIPLAILLMRRLQIGEPEAFWHIQQYCLDSEQPARTAVQAFIEANRMVLEG